MKSPKNRTSNSFCRHQVSFHCSDNHEVKPKVGPLSPCYCKQSVRSAAARSPRETALRRPSCLTALRVHLSNSRASALRGNSSTLLTNRNNSSTQLTTRARASSPGEPSRGECAGAGGDSLGAGLVGARRRRGGQKEQRPSRLRGSEAEEPVRSHATPSRPSVFVPKRVLAPMGAHASADGTISRSIPGRGG